MASPIAVEAFPLPKTSNYHVDIEINGFRLNRVGSFVVTNNRGVWLGDGAAGLQLVTAEAEGFNCQLNDCTADAASRLLSGSCFYDPTQSYELGRLFRIDIEGSAAVLDEGFHLANGLAFAPPWAHALLRRLGCACDLFLRLRCGHKVERRIPSPTKQGIVVAFGGADLTDIFITSAARSGPMPVMPQGDDAETGPFGGQLFRINLGIPGKPEYQAAIMARVPEAGLGT